MAVAIRLYLDENLTPAIAEQLRLRKVDAVSVRDLDALSKSDASHLTRSIEMQRAFVTADTDLLVMASAGAEHWGSCHGKPGKHTIGDWVTKLELICYVYNAAEMKNHVEYL